MSTLHKITPNHLSNLFNTDGKKLNGAPFTIKSMKTGKDYTFKISQVPFKEKSFIHIKVEKGYLNFGYVGYFSKDGNIVRRNKEKNVLETISTPAATAVAWLLRQLRDSKYDLLSNSVEIYHLGKCLKCGKTLTDVDSIEYGLGPVCRK